MGTFLVLSSRHMPWVHLDVKVSGPSLILSRINIYTAPLQQNWTSCLISFSTAALVSFLWNLAHLLETYFHPSPVGPRNLRLEQQSS